MNKITSSLLRQCKLCSHPLPIPFPTLTRSIHAIPSRTKTRSINSNYLYSSSFSFNQTQRRSLIIYAEPPLEPPEEPLEGEAVIDLTDSAIAQIARAQTKLGNELLALRVSVESGGCHGYQYKMEVTDKREEDDYLFLPPNSKARLIIDSSSLGLVSGSTIDYATELIGSSFRIIGNPHASEKGGCGCGVSWELKE